MALVYQPNGNIIPGIYQITWEDVVSEFGFTYHRKQLIKGLALANKRITRLWVQNNIYRRRVCV